MSPENEQTRDSVGWPTTMRFSRRLGESLRGAEYAMAIEGPALRRAANPAWLHWFLRTLSFWALAHR